MFPICFQFDYICIVKRLNKILTLRIPGFSNDLGAISGLTNPGLLLLHYANN